MLSTSQKKLFGICVKAILHVHGKGIEKAKASEIETIRKVSDLILTTIHEMSATRPFGRKNEWVRTILELMHPSPDYSFSETIIRDLADIGVTLARLLEGKHRTEATKIMDAQMFCDYAANGLTHPAD